ncbi:MAG: hypothetical protein VX294_04860 [Candidatus Latescibacterota bacterium]|nr:hypothetical protein [Candidatus Latescibacterota bacterium]
MSEENTITWERKNWAIFAGGIGAIVLGYLALRIPPADGVLSLTFAPILLISGYCILVPWAILHHRGKTKNRPEKE